MAKERQVALAGTRPNKDLVEILPQGAPAPKARDVAAKAVGVSGRYVSDAKALARTAPQSRTGNVHLLHWPEVWADEEGICGKGGQDAFG